MKLNQNHIVRFYIMTIAVLGGVALALFLVVNFLVAKKNETQIIELQEAAFPSIENLISLKQELDLYRESLSSAITLQNEFLIEETIEISNQLNQRVQNISRYNADDEARTQTIQKLLNAYIEQGRKLAQTLIAETENYQEFTREASTTNQAYALLQAAINEWLDAKQKSYSLQLDEITKTLNRTNSVASLMGLLIIAGLAALSWYASKRVLTAINQADNLKEAFLATISHELRTPMNGIIGSLNLLKESPLNQEQKELLDAATHSSVYMTKTVDEILTFSDFISGSPKINESEFSLHRLLTYTMLVAHRECEKKQLSFHCDLNSIKNIIVQSDKQKILHVIRRLLDNAVKFTQEGDIYFRIHYKAVTTGDKPFYINFEVEDSGPGVKQELVDEVFRPFHQLESSFTRKHGGLGIGLAICKVVATALGGELKFQNKKNDHGAIVSFGIPCHLRVEEAIESDTPTVIYTAVKPEERTKKVILIVEDNKVNQMVLNKLLQKMEYETRLANNGQEAVNYMEQDNADLILMDCQMPVMDGYEATRRIRNLPGSKSQTPIIAVTANARESDKERCTEVGMNEFMCKPVDAQTLRNQIEHFLDQKPRPLI